MITSYFNSVKNARARKVELLEKMSIAWRNRRKVEIKTNGIYDVKGKLK